MGFVQIAAKLIHLSDTYSAYVNVSI